MCFNPVKITDKHRLHKSSFVVNCGKCSVCRQSLANRRAQKIIHHKPDDSTTYFVTLTYSNDCVPYVLKSDIIDTLRTISRLTPSDYALNTDDYIRFIHSVPIYRDSTITKGRYSTLIKNKVDILDYHELYSSYPVDVITDIPGIRTKLSLDKFHVDPDKISVAYTPDFQKFINRFRTYFYREQGSRLRMSYYYAPEYGPTSQRFHIHALLYLPNTLTYQEVQDLVCKAWPFCDWTEDRKSKSVQPERSAARYVAEYVNCDSKISPFLQKEFPNRSSHSLGFGFGSDVFTFEKVLENFLAYRDFRYTATRVNKAGQVEDTSLYYPKYVVDKYFPKFKGYSRVATSTLRDVYFNPEKYFKPIPGRPLVPSGFTPSKEALYVTPIPDTYGTFVSMTTVQMNFFLKRILRSRSLFASLGYSLEEFADIIVDYHKSLSSDILKSSMMSVPEFESFHNIDDLFNGVVHHEYFEKNMKYIPRSVTLMDSVHELNLKLFNQYCTNIKKRKINNQYRI